MLTKALDGAAVERRRDVGTGRVGVDHLGDELGQAGARVGAQQRVAELDGLGQRAGVVGGVCLAVRCDDDLRVAALDLLQGGDPAPAGLGATLEQRDVYVVIGDVADDDGGQLGYPGVGGLAQVGLAGRDADDVVALEVEAAVGGQRLGDDDLLDDVVGEDRGVGRGVAPGLLLLGDGAGGGSGRDDLGSGEPRRERSGAR